MNLPLYQTVSVVVPAGAEQGFGLGAPPGADGRSIQTVTITDSGHLFLTFSDSSTADLGSVVGRSITSAAVDGPGHLVLGFSDGAFSDLGLVVGHDGRGVLGAELSTGHLVLHFTDGGNVDVGNVIGPAGRGVASAAINTSKHLVLSLTDGTTIDLGVVVGPAGLGLASAALNGSGHLVLTYSDATTADLGVVVGRGIASAAIVSDHLILSYTDGTTADLGNVRGAPGPGSGDLVGPTSAVDGELLVADGTTGKKLKNTGKVVTTFVLGLLTTVSAAALRVLIGIDQYSGQTDANYTILATDRTVALRYPLTAPRLWTLPGAASFNPGQRLAIVDQVGGISAANTLTVTAVGSDTINGAASTVIVAPYANVEIVSDGVSKWTFDVQGITRGGTGATSASAARANLLPAFASNASKLLRVNAAATDIEYVGGLALIRVARSASTMLGASDTGKFFELSGTFSQAFDTPANLGAGWWTYVSSTGKITIPSSDGVTNWIMYPGEIRLFLCDGTSLISKVLHAFAATFISSGSMIVPPGYTTLGGILRGGGGGGAKNGFGANGNYILGGNGGAAMPLTLSTSVLGVGSTQAFTIGAGGTGASTNGGTGTSGGLSTFAGVTALGGASGMTTTGTGGDTLSMGAMGLNQDSGYNGKASYSSASPQAIYGGGAGGYLQDTPTVFSAGTSYFAGSGGSAGTNGVGSDGTAPAGGGGATNTGAKAGNGARGQLDLYGIV